ncbi:oligosaccharide flippase family protein [Acaryochloris sp. IP29b_bin.148]|uniref:oligosaccharide flippase family protein n=1 Tax=Acaryochloris sp. IP29b_bin.148 TaxID=2969218 RepID=UPI002623E54D|nr:oligosaccharide flippase family protein [Acaryochloris sp. IP29b_bin.148]
MQHLFKKAGGTFSLRIASMFFAFVMGVIHARLMGSTGSGIYDYSTSWVYLLAIPASLGFNGLLGREIALYQTEAEWEKLVGLKRWASLLTLIISVGLALVAGTIAWHTIQDETSQLTWAFWMAMVSLPFLSLRMIYRAMMRGLDKIVVGLMPEMIWAPFVQLTVVVFIVVGIQNELTASSAVIAFSLSTGLSLIISILTASRFLPEKVKAAKPSYERLTWLKCAVPFMLLESLNEINSRVDILMIGNLDSVSAAGIYNPVNRGSLLITFVLMAFKGPLSPTITTLFAKGELQELQRILTKTARVVVVFSGLATISFLIFGNQYLKIYGSEFTKGLGALNIRCLGLFVYAVVAGHSSTVLSMTGYARFTAISSILATGMNIVLNMLLIPIYGINGAAIATTTSLLVSGAINANQVHKTVGLRPTILRDIMKLRDVFHFK